MSGPVEAHRRMDASFVRTAPIFEQVYLPRLYKSSSQPKERKSMLLSRILAPLVAIRQWVKGWRS